MKTSIARLIFKVKILCFDKLLSEKIIGFEHFFAGKLLNKTLGVILL